MDSNEKAKLILSEADWLDEAARNANPDPRVNSAEFLRGFKTAARWVRFHGNHPHLLEGRYSGEENEGTTTAGEVSSTAGTRGPDSS